MLKHWISFLALVWGTAATANADNLYIVAEEAALSDSATPTGYVLPDGRWFNHEQMVRACSMTAGSGRSAYSLKSGQCRDLVQLAEPERGLLSRVEGNLRVVDLMTGQRCRPGSCKVMTASGPTAEERPPEVFQDRFERETR